METLIEKTPYIAAIVFVVLVFVRSWAKDAERRERYDTARMEQLERIGENCHTHTKDLNDRAVKAIDNASRIIEDNTKIIGAVERRMNGGFK